MQGRSTEKFETCKDELLQPPASGDCPTRPKIQCERLAFYAWKLSPGTVAASGSDWRTFWLRAFNATSHCISSVRLAYCQALRAMSSPQFQSARACART
jgi:hypothetical protein